MGIDSRSIRPWHAAIALGVAAQLLFLVNLGTPSIKVFDETHYVTAAQALLTLEAPYNIEHPMLGKIIMALGIMIFGDNSFGWRFFSTVAGTGVVLGTFSIAWQVIGRVRPAVIAALLTLLNFTVYIQARIGMLDGFMAAFVVLAVAVLLWAARGSGRQVALRLLLAGLLMGLGIGSKWAAVPYFGLAGIAIIAVRWWDAQRLGEVPAFALGSRDQPHFAGVATIPALLMFGGVSLVTYFATFTPAFYYKNLPLTIGQLLPFQLEMFKRQIAPLPPHPYQSGWWTWPFDIRPIWYLYETIDGAVRGVLMIGNPAIMWGGLIAVAACLYIGWRDRVPSLIAAGSLWLAAYLPWVIIPKKVGFFYYYYLPSIFLCLALAAILDHVGTGRWKNADAWFTLLSFALFVYFFPIISAAALPNDQAFLHWMWLPTWP